jgi:hypothetical protein
MFKEPDEPSMFDEIQTVVFANPEKIGKVFRVLNENLHLCLICDGVFTPAQAAEHATAPCCVVFNASSDKSSLRERRLRESRCLHRASVLFLSTHAEPMSCFPSLQAFRHRSARRFPPLRA